ncbi:GAF domain-containing protein [Saccharopolyspora sp. 5N102]|uniref:GAF domain-containing protein n=1 Tax=Saccharopolyspora sp. 5N102 TaxID=3375155 RepID=UPI0037A0C524
MPLGELLLHLLATVPGADMAGIHGSCALASLHTDERARDLDAGQFRDGAGPCVEAARSGLVVRADVTEVRVHWPSFARRAREARIHSFLVLPLAQDRRLLGTLSLYGHHSHAFAEGDEALVLGAPALGLACAALRAEIAGTGEHPRRP